MPLTKGCMAYKPEPGSLAARVIDLFSRNLEEEFMSRDIGTKFDVPSGSVNALLHAAQAHGMLVFTRSDTEGTPKVWRAGPNLTGWLTLQTGAAVSLASLAAAAPSGRTGARQTKHGLDPLAVSIQSGVPIPSVEQSRAITSPYPVLWERMKPGDCVQLPVKQAASFIAYLRKNKGTFTMRTTAVGSKTIWLNA